MEKKKWEGVYVMVITLYIIFIDLLSLNCFNKFFILQCFMKHNIGTYTTLQVMTNLHITLEINGKIQEMPILYLDLTV